MWTKVKTHHYTGRDDEAFRSLVKIGEGDPVNAINNIPHGELVDDYAFLTAEVIFFCGENNMAVKLFHYMKYIIVIMTIVRVSQYILVV